MWIDEWLSLLSSSSSLIPLIAALVFWHRLDRPMRALGAMFLLAVLCEAASVYLAYNGTSNLWLGQIWTAVEIPCILFVLSCWQINGKVRRTMRGAIPVFLLVLVLNKVFLESFDTIDSYSRPLGSALIVAAALITFQRILAEPGEGLLRDPRFLVSSAALIYHAGNMTLFTLGMHLLMASPDTFSAIYDVHSVINISTNLLYAGGFLCRPRL